MALIHGKATVTPTKLDALAGWLPGRPWAAGLDVSAPTQVGGFRFDDPAGEVGIETLLVRAAGGPILQVPLTYRAEPLAGAEDALVGTLEHSVLGRRWCYDGCADPVALRALAAAIRTGGRHAPEVFDSGGEREPSVHVTGSGAPGTAVPAFVTASREDTPTGTVVQAGDLLITVRRRLDAPAPLGETLTATWADQPEPVVLAALTVRG